MACDGASTLLNISLFPVGTFVALAVQGGKTSMCGSPALLMLACVLSALLWLRLAQRIGMAGTLLLTLLALPSFVTSLKPPSTRPTQLEQ